MKKVWIGMFAMAALLTAAVTVGVVSAQDTGDGENTGPKTILSRVAAILGLQEATVEDAFQQARKDQRTEAYRKMLDRRVGEGLITSEEADEQFLWLQSRPDSLNGSFRLGGQRRPGFGHAGFSRGKHFGMSMAGHGGRWRGLDHGFFHWNKGDGQKSGQQEVTPSEPSSEPDPISQ